jgi:hypothetical protein
MECLINLYRWLEAADHDTPDARVIFVLAGRECRKDFALALFERGLSDVLLMSIARFEIRRFISRGLELRGDLQQLAASIAPEARHFFVTRWSTGQQSETEQIPVGRFGTWSEIRAFSRWLGDNQRIRTGLVVSSGFHLRRVRWCCRFLVTESVRLKFAAVPEERPQLNAMHWWSTSVGRKLVLSEVPKLLAYGLLLWPRRLRSVKASKTSLY